MTLLAFLWGFSEATVYFVVPDVILTYAVVKRGFRRAAPVAIVTLVGALIGGAVMHGWGESDPEAARKLLDRIPAISPQMIDAVSAQAGDRYPAAMVKGSLTGIPYKVFAVVAGSSGIALPTFLFASIGARMLRWCLLMALTAGIVALMRRRGIERHARMLWLTLWLAFYLFYLTVMPG